MSRRPPSRQECSHPCNGNCCRSFTLPYSPVEIGKRRAETLPAAITDMLIYQGSHRTAPVPGIGTVENSNPVHWYGCKHFDDYAGRCTNYEKRPQMCRTYPYRKRCNYVGCDYRKPAESLRGDQGEIECRSKH